MFETGKSFYNPAFTACEGKISTYHILGLEQLRYMRFGNRIMHVRGLTTQVNDLSAQLFSTKKHMMGLGFNYSKQSYDVTFNRDYRLNFSYTYTTSMGKFKAGLNFDKVQSWAYYGYFYSTNGNGSQIKLNNLNLGMGIGYFSNTGNFYAGLSSLRFIKHTIPSDTSKYMFDVYKNNIYLMWGFKYKFNARWELRPSILWEYYNRELMVNLMAQYKKHLNFGIYYFKKDEHVGGLRLGYQSRYFTLNYSYGISLGRITNVAGGTHTIGLLVALRDK